MAVDDGSPVRSGDSCGGASGDEMGRGASLDHGGAPRPAS